MSGIPVLVTGGAGYIGAHACKALAEGGYAPIAYDNLSSGHRGFAQWGELVTGDIRDAQKLTETMRRHRIEAVLHFAAHADVGESVADPQKYYDTNVGGTLSLLGAMREAGCRRMVFSSSCAVYGQPARSPITEDTPPDPINPYGASKWMAERVLADHRAAYGLQFVALRYFNASGADAGGEIGELRTVETHLIPRALMHIQGHCDDFRIFGGDFDTPDGTAIRDYVHVCDLADGHVGALQALDRGVSGAFNLGTGRGHSVQQVLDVIGEETGIRLAAEQGPRRPGDPAVLVADATRATQQLRWSPRRSDLREIVRSSWRWHRKAHPARVGSKASALA